MRSGVVARACPSMMTRAVRHALARKYQFASQVMVGDAAPASAELGAPHRCGHAQYRQLGRGRRRHGYPVGRLENYFVIMDISTLGQQRRHCLGGVVGAAAADADEHVGLHFPGHFYAGLHRLHRRVGRHPGIGAGVAWTQSLPDPRNHVARLQDGGAAGDHGPPAAEAVHGPG